MIPRILFAYKYDKYVPILQVYKPYLQVYKPYLQIYLIGNIITF